MSVVFFASSAPTPTRPAGSSGVPAGGDPSRETPPEEGTRERILAIVSESGPVTVAQVAETLQLTTAGVRRHVDVLAEQDLVTTVDPPGAATRGRGRPARAYVLTPAGHDQMSTRYDDVATAALRYLSEAIGPHAVTAFAQQRVADLEQRYAAEVAAAGPVLGDRVHALAAALARDGYAASTRPLAGSAPGTPSPANRDGAPAGAEGLQLCQGHCPMHQVAAEFPQFCDVETEAFARLLGVHVQRLSTLAGGSHVCTTFIPQSTPQSISQVSTPARVPLTPPSTSPSLGSNSAHDQSHRTPTPEEGNPS